MKSHSQALNTPASRTPEDREHHGILLDLRVLARFAVMTVDDVDDYKLGLSDEDGYS
jgi:hypothetical protein